MPTGYTADIKDGISFSTFALNCARAFGATITLRDESGGGEAIPEKFEPDCYHLRALTVARETLAALESMTAAECDLKASAEHAEAEVQRISVIKERDDLRQQYHEMLGCVAEWVPPSEEHIGLKKFMVEQIASSVKVDCDTSYYTASPLLTGPEWLEAAKAKAIKDIEYHTTKHAEEVERTDQRNAWVRALRDSL